MRAVTSILPVPLSSYLNPSFAYCSDWARANTHQKSLMRYLCICARLISALRHHHYGQLDRY